MLVVFIFMLQSFIFNHNINEEYKLLDKNNGIYVKYYFLTESTYFIEWGDKKIKNVSKLKYETLGNGSLGIEMFNEYGIVLRQGTGTSSWINIVLPLEENNNEIKFDYGITYDLKNHIIIRSNIKGPFLTIENYRHMQKQDIYENNVCSTITPFECIDSCKIIDNYLFVWYQGNNWKDFEHPDPKYKKIKITI